MKCVWALAMNLRRLLLTLDHLALTAGWLPQVNTLTDLGREEGKGSKAR